MVQTSAEEAYRKFDELTNKHIETLRRLTKAIQDARIARETEAIKQSLKEYDDALERYIPVLMAQARIYWDRENYQQVEKLFRQSAEFCSEHEVWKLNVAHVFFMQETKFKEAIRSAPYARALCPASSAAENTFACVGVALLPGCLECLFLTLIECAAGTTTRS